MRQDVDRRVGGEHDVVAAAGERTFEVARIERLEKIQYPLPVEILPVEIFGHFFLRRGWAGFIVNRIAARSIGKRIMHEIVHNPRVHAKAA